MKTLLKLTAVAVALVSASPALACGEEKMKAADAQPQKAAVAAKVEKKAVAPAKATTAKDAPAPAVASRN